MKICPKCRGLYFDQDQQCDNCKIELYDKNLFAEIENELYKMGETERKKHRFEERYQIICKYQYPYEYEYNEQKSQQEYEELQRRVQQKMIEKERIEKQQNTPKCPTCGSTNVHPISSGKKAIGFLTVGIFSSSFGKSYECDNCKYKW